MYVSCVHSEAAHIEGDPGLEGHVAIGEYLFLVLSPAGRGLKELWQVQQERKENDTSEVFEDNLDIVVADMEPEAVTINEVVKDIRVPPKKIPLLGVSGGT